MKEGGWALPEIVEASHPFYEGTEDVYLWEQLFPLTWCSPTLALGGANRDCLPPNQRGPWKRPFCPFFIQFSHQDIHFVFLRSVRRLLLTASVVPSSSILVTLMKEGLSSSETSVLTRATRRNIPEDAILQHYLCFQQEATGRWWNAAMFHCCLNRSKCPYSANAVASSLSHLWIIVNGCKTKGVDVILEVFTAVTKKNALFWFVTPCGSCKNRRFGGTYRPIIRVTRNGELGTTLTVTRNRNTLWRNASS
jgi:hypothetical protein